MAEEPAPTNETFVAERAVHLRPNRVLAIGPLVVLVAPVVFALAVQLGLGLLAALAQVALLAGVFGVAFGRLANRWPGRVEGRLTVGLDGVFLSGKRLAGATDIRAGLVVPRGLDFPMVRLDRGFSAPLDLEVQDEAQGGALLRALGLDASQAVATFKTPSRALTDRRYRVASTIAVVVVALSTGAPQQPLSLFVRFGLLAALVGFATLVRTRLDVGADGILTTWLGRRRFIPYHEIASVASYVDERGMYRSRYFGVAVTTTAGDTIRLPITQVTALDSSNRVHGVLQRIREAIEAYRGGHATPAAAALDRGERSERAWVVALRAIGSGAALDHRTAPLLPEQLWRVVEDPSQKPAVRAGAAVVLGSTVDDAGRARLRVTARAVAEPKVRIALEAAADGGDDDEALERALAELPEEGLLARVVARRQ